MNNKMMKILLVTFLFVNAFAYCGTLDSIISFAKQIELLQSQIESNQTEKTEKRNAILLTNIAYLESRVNKKLNHAEEKLEKYKKNLSNSENGEEVKLWFKKISPLEKKIKSLSEILFAIDLLKNKAVE